MAGRKYKIPRLNAIISEIMDTGYRYDTETGTFVEDRSIRTTRNWGVLREGETYVMAFMGIDVAGNSELVRNYGREDMRRIYDAIRSMTTESVERRNGRLWSWEGDGGLYAFTFEEQNQRAAISAVEVLHEIFLYNLGACPVLEGVHVRLTVHNGPCTYATDGSELKCETVKRLWETDRLYGQPDTLTITPLILPTLGPELARAFAPHPVRTDGHLHTYAVRCV
jgi:class 3 adenylate cyclase